MGETDTKLDILITEDRLRAVLKCPVSEDDRGDLLDEIEEALSELGLADAPSRADIAEMLTNAAKSGNTVLETTLVEGLRPTPPKPGRIDWARDFFSEGFLVDEETGAVDYRVRTGQPAVEEGELLATVIPPVRGKPGRDVFGKAILAGDVQSLRIGHGLNVRIDEESRQFYATAPGRARWAGCVLSVDDVLVIKGSVGLETGNIHHPGAIIIEKDVEGEAQVKAEGDIEVRGIVEEADVETGGTLSVRGGITGSPKRHIFASGSVCAKFVLDATIRAGEDVAAQRELVHSDVFARGRVIVPQGRVVGGCISGLGGIDAGQVGSEAHVLTTLIAGVDEEKQAAIAEKERSLEDQEQQLEKMRATVDPLLRRRTALTEERQKALQALLDSMKELEESIGELTEEIQRAKAELKERSNLKITVRKLLYPETKLRLGNLQIHLKETYRGPLVAKIVHGEIELSPL